MFNGIIRIHHEDDDILAVLSRVSWVMGLIGPSGIKGFTVQRLVTHLTHSTASTNGSLPPRLYCSSQHFWNCSRVVQLLSPPQGESTGSSATTTSFSSSYLFFVSVTISESPWSHNSDPQANSTSKMRLLLPYQQKFGYSST